MSDQVPETTSLRSPPPSSILIIGAGSFGLSSTHALLSSPTHRSTSITLVDAYVPPPPSPPASSPSDAPLSSAASDPARRPLRTAQRCCDHAASPQPHPHPDPERPHVTASLDSSRIVRADYPKPAYARLAAQAQERWRGGWPWSEEAGNREEKEEEEGEAGGDRGRGADGRRKRVYWETGLMLTATENAKEEEEVRRGRQYVEESLGVVEGMAGVGGDGIGGAGAGGVDGRTKTVERLESADEVRRCFYRSGDTAWDEKEGEESKEGNMEKVWGANGYMNRGSGWANAAGAMEGLREVVRGLALKRQVAGGSGEFEWVHEKVERLIFGNVDNAEEKVVLGAGLEGGGEIRADTTILAAGAWSAALMPRELGPRLRAKGQVLGYVKLNREEASVYSGKPVIYDMTTGRFIMSPPPIDEDPKARIEGDNEGAILKVARHGHGYAHKVKVEDPIDGDIHTVFLPPPDFQTLPKEGDDDLRDFLQTVFPSLGSKHWCQTRVCVYTDTPSGDFLIDWIPGYGDSILIASGGSGHGYKFTPVIGERIVAKLESKLADENDASGLGKMLEQLWRWRSDEEVEKGWHGAGDGSRGGPKGMMWEEEIAKR